MAWQRGKTSRTSTTEWKRLRREALRVFGNYCARCSADGRHVRLELDHIIPDAEGGIVHLDNAQLLCVDCHKIKTQAEAQRGRSRAAAAGRRRRSGKRAPRVHPSDVLMG